MRFKIAPFLLFISLSCLAVSSFALTAHEDKIQPNSPKTAVAVYGNLSTVNGSIYGDGSKLTGISTRPPSYTNVSGMATGAMPKAGGTFTGPVSGVSLGNDLLANHFKLIAAACDNGAILPSSPVLGQWFLHTPTGRQTLCIYTGSEWESIMSLGTTTVYVDATNGMDSQDKGYGTSVNAYKTIQFAVDNIGDIFCGNVVINISADIYREAVIIQGKTPCGNFTISLTGAWTTTLADTTATSAAARTSATANASITKTSAGWTINAYQYKMLYIASGKGSGQYRPILSNTADTISVEAWATTPDNTSHFIVYDWGTRITGSDAGADTTPVRAYAINIKSGQQNVSLSHLWLDYTTSYNLFIESATNGTVLNECNFSHSNSYNMYTTSPYTMYSCYFHDNPAGYMLSDQAPSGFIFVYDSWFNKTGSGDVIQKRLTGNTQFWRNRIDDNGAGQSGIYATTGGNATLLGSPHQNSIVNCGVGIKADNFGQISAGYATALFSGNTVDKLISSMNKQAGTATLSGGTVTVANTAIAATDIILLTRVSGVAQIGTFTYTISAGTSFTISSTNNLDTGVVAYQIISP